MQGLERSPRYPARSTEGYPPYVQPCKGDYCYRRKVPLELQAALGKTEIIIPLGKNQAEAVRRYQQVHEEANRRLSPAPAAFGGSVPQPLTTMERFRWAERRARSLDPEDREDHRDLIAEGIAQKYPEDDEGYPVGVSADDEAAIGALMMGDRQGRPEPTLEDANSASSSARSTAV